MISEASKQQLRQCVLQEDWVKVVALCQSLLAQSQDVRLFPLLGEALGHQGKFTQAVEAYLQGLAIKPEQPESHYMLAVLYTRQQKMALAICHYQLALQLSPGWSKAAFGLARLFHRLGNSDRALWVYKDMLVRDPNYADAHFSIGLLYEQKGADELAIKHYRNTIFAQRDHANAYRYLGAILVRIEAYDAAVDVYTQAIAACPAEAALHTHLGQLWQQKGETQFAIESFQRALSIDPTSVVAHQNLGRLSSRYQSPALAVRHFQQAMQCADKSARHRKDTAAVASDYAWALASGGQWDEVLACFRFSTSAYSDFVEAYCQRTTQLPDDDLLFQLQRICSRFLRGLQRFGEAIAFAEGQSFEDSAVASSLSHVPVKAATEKVSALLKARLAQVYERLADLSMACDAPARAQQCYQFALSLSPNTWHLYRSLGTCLMVQDKWVGAIAVYQAGLVQGELFAQQATTVDGYTRSTLFAWEKAQLQQRLNQALLEQKRPLAVSVKGVYRYAKDWLSDVGLAAPSLSNSPPQEAAADKRYVPVGTRPDPECGGLTCQRCMTDLIRQFSPVQVTNSAFRCGQGPTEKAADASLPEGGAADRPSNGSVHGATLEAAPLYSLPSFALTIPKGRVWVAPQKNTWSVCNEIAVFSPDDFLLGDLSRCYPWHLPGCGRHNAANHTVFQRQTPLPSVEELSGRVVVLSGLSGHIYYHWLYDVLPRLKVLYDSLQSEGRSLKDIDYFVVNSVEKSFQHETLQRLGIPMDKVIESDRMPHIRAEQLIVPNFAGPLDWVPPSSMDFLRQAFLRNPRKRPKKVSDIVASFGKRIYINRQKAKYRQVFNETAVINLLSNFGFVSVAPETLSVMEQAELFSNAEAVVAPHGSGLANLVFCSPNTTVIEFFSPYYLRTDYWMISQYLQLRHYYLLGESFPFHPLRQLMYPSGLTEDFSVDLSALRSLLQQADLTT